MKRLLLHVAALTLASALLAISASTASAEIFKPGQVSKITAAVGSNLKIVDHESFGADEIVVHNLAGTPFGALGYSIKSFGTTRRSWCGGDEVRIELETRGWTMDPYADTMRVEARINLYEGASCATTDLDGPGGWKEIYLQPGTSKSLSFKAFNTHEGGDWAEAWVTFTASK